MVKVIYIFWLLGEIFDKSDQIYLYDYNIEKAVYVSSDQKNPLQNWTATFRLNFPTILAQVAVFTLWYTKKSIAMHAPNPSIVACGYLNGLMFQFKLTKENDGKASIELISNHLNSRSCKKISGNKKIVLLQDTVIFGLSYINNTFGVYVTSSESSNPTKKKIFLTSFKDEKKRWKNFFFGFSGSELKQTKSLLSVSNFRLDEIEERPSDYIRE